ncbi:hypothetical protein P175DRAFT_0515670 [Aspergillus ochraceoroseus IBT 24754]|uniref:Mating-type alpha-pheromone receptor PreB n=3 Tax=Aspergillus subgen. Nidulantes TaxID=2720870 RepID=A0A0F8U3T7_9EURO|nr:uncharacterized protein P175DRAFT_0515670 [Aspergillus ochraceoroseus IBT 24754]KKK14404.1 hypothetical protein ARAM_000069 [Aspergillus rambellii]KKK16119.1 hypothetical protein AOCH_001228 [Aspergillus ochraceoroseus]PTU21548.1 hypothetical protein P175DRAFT_0515670 [Aspergillus ochraceoroseus IBT 24754]
MTSTFDPYTQNVTFHLADGTPFDVPITAIDDFLQYAIRICINYSSQLGASVVLLVILLLLTMPEKRSSFVFCLNCLALLLNIGRLLDEIIFFTTPFVGAYQYFSGDYSSVPASAYGNSVLGVVLTSLLLTFIETSLLLQIQVVCANLRRQYRRILLGISVLVALIPVALRLWFMVENARNIIDTSNPHSVAWLESATNIVITVSICFFCAIFVTKLGFAIRLRRQLGFNDFGPMKVIFVMGCQTMVIPAVFSIVHYATTVPELSSNVLTLVTLSLPLSSIWAGTTLDRSSSTSARRNLWQVLSFSDTSRSKQTSSSSSSSGVKSCTKCYSDSHPADKKGSGLTSPYEIAVEHDILVSSTTRNYSLV